MNRGNKMNEKKSIPVLYSRREECCGCTACYAICPQGAISMMPDEEGFKYPQIDKKKCIGCGMCIDVYKRQSIFYIFFC